MSLRASLALAGAIAAITLPVAGAAAAPRIAVLTPTAAWAGECRGGAWHKDSVLQERCMVLETLADEIRSGALAAVEGRDIDVMTRENTAQLLKEMGSSATCAEGECEVETARLIGADYVVSGNVVLVEGTWLVTMKVHSVKTARLLRTSDRIKVRSQVELIEAVAASAETMLRRALNIGGAPARAAAPAAVPPPALREASAPPPTTMPSVKGAACPAGQEEVAGHCCWLGQDWAEGAGRCIGTPTCPDGFIVSGQGCAPGCPAGKVLVGGHCCWPGQDWGARATKCVGEPVCPKSSWFDASQGCLSPPQGMVRVVGGVLKRADPEAVTGVTFQNVSHFFLDETEVTVAAYARCASAGKCTPAASTVEWDRITDQDRKDWSPFCNGDRPDRAMHPVNCVTYDQANAYCEWAGKRLPSEWELEWAARNGDKATTYPWGNAPPAKQLCWNGEKRDLRAHPERPGTCLVGSTPGESDDGVKDLAGNVWEWAAAPRWGGRTSTPSRGGGWTNDNPTFVAATARDVTAADRRATNLGFRCAKDF